MKMASPTRIRAPYIVYLFLVYQIIFTKDVSANEILGCGGFVNSHVNLDFSKIEIGLYTKEGSLKEKTECAPTNGYYFLPLYEKGEYVLKLHPPPGWSFEPSKVELLVDGATDQCSSGQDINFAFNGFGITGKVVTAGQNIGPGGIAVELVNDKGDVRNTVTTSGGDFHFTPVIPGKYTIKASHQKWKLDPAESSVQVKEGNTVLPIGVLAVKGYEVKGSISSYGNPIAGVYVVLYSKQDNQKLRVEGCNTALLQGVPDSPICHAITTSNGEFTFGLVPAGDYKLVALSKPPGQVAISYNVKPEKVDFTVRHDSLYLKNAFEVTGFTIISSVLKSTNGVGLQGARVLVNDNPTGVTDKAGRYTLQGLQPGQYVVTFQHEECEIAPAEVRVAAGGAVSAPAAAVRRWRVCGSVWPLRRLAVVDDRDRERSLQLISPDQEGKWCKFFAPGEYTAKVEVTEQEQRDGLQFYPLTQKISVSSSPVEGIVFSQLKARVTGKVECQDKRVCEGLEVTLRPLSPDGGYIGTPMTAVVKDGEYRFEDVLPGSVQVTAPTSRLCWAEAVLSAAVSHRQTTLPPLEHSGYALLLRSTHDIEVEYSSPSSKGVLVVPSGESLHCVAKAERYALTPRGCHRFRPERADVDVASDDLKPVSFTAVSHAAVVTVTAPTMVKDLVLKINTGNGTKEVGPLEPLVRGSSYAYEHTIFLAENEMSVVSAWSSALVFSPSGPQQMLGRSQCQAQALLLEGRAARRFAGRLVPPVAGATVSISDEAGDVDLSVTTAADGAYAFGPLDAAKRYRISAQKESYVFGEADSAGDIRADRLAEILVRLLDDADGAPLQGALVSVSGGSYRRNLASGASGELRFASLAPAQYYVKPLMKEYTFEPKHRIVQLGQGQLNTVTIRGVRVAWSCSGHLLQLGGAGRGGATLLAQPAPHSAVSCAPEEATTENDGRFRIRGLLPDCVYSLQLKESSAPDLAGIRLVKAPKSIDVKDHKDIENLKLIAIQPHPITDVNVLVHADNIDHYKSLRLTLALESAPLSAVYSAKLDAGGYSHYCNPGLMYALPRLQADNRSYVLALDSSLSKATHAFDEQALYFTSDGTFKHFTIHFSAKIKSSDQELGQTSLLVVPLLAALVVAFLNREKLLDKAIDFAANITARPQGKAPKANKPEVLDKASIDQILSTVNAAGKKQPKKKAQ